MAEERFGPLYLGSFIAYGDRFLIGPLLVIIAADFGISLGAAAAVATSYLLVYGVSQPVYGFLSDRWGRVRVMRYSLMGVVAANVSSALAPNVEVLMISRGIGAGFVAALLPTSLVYVGDRVPFARRQQTIANVLAAGAVGTVAATVGAGLLGSYTTWRLVFLVPAALALMDAVALGRLPESLPAEAGAGPLVQIRRLLARPWALFLMALALAEGGVMLGFVTFLAPALQVHGLSSAAAGLVVATYGVAVFGGLQMVKCLLRQTEVPAPTMIVIGGTILVVAFLIASSAQDSANILAASMLLGVGYSFMHSTLQTWATEVAPDARGTAISMFVTAVFIGASIVHIQVAPLASDHRFRSLFMTGAAMTVPVTLAAAVSRARFAKRH